MPENIYQQFPDFCTFLEDSYLLSQMKISRHPEHDTVKLVVVQENHNEREVAQGITTEVAYVLEEEDEPPPGSRVEPAINVEGEWLNDTVLRALFKIDTDSEKEKFLFHRFKGGIFTYLCNGNGLQRHNPKADDHAIDYVSEAEYQELLGYAQPYQRTIKNRKGRAVEESAAARRQKTPQRTGIIQVVSSTIETPDTNLHNFLVKPRHLYLRYIPGEADLEFNWQKGDVYEIGLVGGENRIFPFSSADAVLRTPDCFEFDSKRTHSIVTNIAVTHEELRNMYQFISRERKTSVDANKPISFHLAKQNCTVLVRLACEAAGVVFPTAIHLTGALALAAPNWIQWIGRQLAFAYEKTRDAVIKGCQKLPDSFGKPLLTLIGKIVLVIEKFFAYLGTLGIAPIRLFSGSFFREGHKGRVLALEPEVADEEFAPPMRKPKEYIDSSSLMYNIPAVGQMYQLKHLGKATFIVDNPIRVTTLPYSRAEAVV